MPFDALDLDFALAVAAQVGAAIATAEHVGRIERLAYTDALTGLANRRAVDEWLDGAFARFAGGRGVGRAPRVRPQRAQAASTTTRATRSATGRWCGSPGC